MANSSQYDRLVLLEGSRENITHGVSIVAQRLLGRADSISSKTPGDGIPVLGGLVIFCAGCMLYLGEDIAKAARLLDRSLGSAPFLGFHTFGEQGQLVDGSSRHGNLMYSALLFRGRRRQRKLRRIVDCSSSAFEEEAVDRRKTFSSRTSVKQVIQKIRGREWQRCSRHVLELEQERFARIIKAGRLLPELEEPCLEVVGDHLHQQQHYRMSLPWSDIAVRGCHRLDDPRLRRCFSHGGEVVPSWVADVLNGCALDDAGYTGWRWGCLKTFVLNSEFGSHQFRVEGNIGLGQRRPIRVYAVLVGHPEPVWDLMPPVEARTAPAAGDKTEPAYAAGTSEQSCSATRTPGFSRALSGTSSNASGEIHHADKHSSSSRSRPEAEREELSLESIDLEDIQDALVDHGSMADVIGDIKDNKTNAGGGLRRGLFRDDALARHCVGKRGVFLLAVAGGTGGGHVPAPQPSSPLAGVVVYEWQEEEDALLGGEKWMYVDQPDPRAQQLKLMREQTIGCENELPRSCFHVVAVQGLHLGLTVEQEMRRLGAKMMPRWVSSADSVTTLDFSASAESSSVGGPPGTSSNRRVSSSSVPGSKVGSRRNSGAISEEDRLNISCGSGRGHSSSQQPKGALVSGPLTSSWSASRAAFPHVVTLRSCNAQTHEASTLLRDCAQAQTDKDCAQACFGVILILVSAAVAALFDVGVGFYVVEQAIRTPRLGGELGPRQNAGGGGELSTSSDAIVQRAMRRCVCQRVRRESRHRHSEFRSH